MANYVTAGYVTAEHGSIEAARQALENFLEQYPSGMTIHGHDVMPLGRGQVCVGWAIFDGQWLKLVNSASHLHFADNIILTEV